MASIRQLVGALLRDDRVRAISRRYFVSNGFDGALTCIGLVIGAYLTGVTDGVTVVEIGVGAAVGLTTSGVWSVWEIERAEKRAELGRIEDAMLADLGGTGVHGPRGGGLPSRPSRAGWGRRVRGRAAHEVETEFAVELHERRAVGGRPGYRCVRCVRRVHGLDIGPAVVRRRLRMALAGVAVRRESAVFG